MRAPSGRFLFIFYFYSVFGCEHAGTHLHGRQHLGLMWNIPFALNPAQCVLEAGNDQTERLGISGGGGLYPHSEDYGDPVTLRLPLSGPLQAPQVFRLGCLRGPEATS